jgi:hypothetical protein
MHAREDFRSNCVVTWDEQGSAQGHLGGELPRASPAHIAQRANGPILAYRIQVQEYGGLSNSARQKLKQIATDLNAVKRPRSHVAASLEAETKFIRSWGGEMHEVTTSGDGYAYRGRQFNSLSQVAREITGTRWSGPLFFGTRKKAA